MADTDALAALERSDDWGQGRAGAGAGATYDPSSTSDQYRGSERAASGQTRDFTDPTTGRTWQGDRDDDTAGRPSVTSKVMGAS